MKTIFFIFLFLISVGKSFAVTGTPNEIFRPLSQHLVEILLDKGIEEIGNLNIEKLNHQLSKVEWRTFDLGFLAGSGGKRTTSVYMTDQKMVVVNMYSLKNLVGKPVHLHAWALHESLGALGYSDENYELSSSIAFLARNIDSDNPDLSNYIAENFLHITRSKTNRLYAMNGGSTVVGGGGDAIIIELKQRLLDRYFIWIKKNNLNLSPDDIKKGVNKIIHYAIDSDFEADNYNNFDFHFKDQQLLIGMGCQLLPQNIYTDDYLDRILDELQTK